MRAGRQTGKLGEGRQAGRQAGRQVGEVRESGMCA